MGFSDLPRERFSRPAPAVGEKMGNASRHVRAPPPASREASIPEQLKSFNLSNPAAYAKFHAGSLNIALLPDALCPLLAAALSSATKRGDLVWISYPARENLADPQWASARCWTRRGECIRLGESSEKTGANTYFVVSRLPWARARARGDQAHFGS